MFIYHSTDAASQIVEEQKFRTNNVFNYKNFLISVLQGVEPTNVRHINDTSNGATASDYNIQKKIVSAGTNKYAHKNKVVNYPGILGTGVYFFENFRDAVEYPKGNQVLRGEYPDFDESNLLTLEKKINGPIDSLMYIDFDIPETKEEIITWLMEYLLPSVKKNEFYEATEAQNIERLLVIVAMEIDHNFNHNVLFPGLAVFLYTEYGNEYTVDMNYVGSVSATIDSIELKRPSRYVLLAKSGLTKIKNIEQMEE